MLKHAPNLTTGGVDTAENGPSKVRQATNKIHRNMDYKGIDSMTADNTESDFSGVAELHNKRLVMREQ